MRLIRSSFVVFAFFCLLALEPITAKAQGNQPQQNQAPVGHRQPTASGVGQEPEQLSPADKKLKELDDALSKKLKGICRGC